MGFKPPLPTDQLRAIQERNQNSANVRALLWEIKRMRATLLYADQLQRMLTTLPGPQGAILDTLREKLRNEPCVRSSRGYRRALDLESPKSFRFTISGSLTTFASEPKRSLGSAS
jgi:hypothetical protein